MNSLRTRNTGTYKSELHFPTDDKEVKNKNYTIKTKFINRKMHNWKELAITEI